MTLVALKIASASSLSCRPSRLTLSSDIDLLNRRYCGSQFRSRHFIALDYIYAT